MERINSTKRRTSETNRAVTPESWWFFGTIFLVWALIGIVLAIVADSTVAVLATLAWACVLLAFGAWLMYRMWIGAT